MSELSELIYEVDSHAVDDHIGHHGWGRVAKKLLGWLLYFMARSRLWKRAAKKWRRRFHALTGDLVKTYEELQDAEATATRRKELLVEVRQLLDAIYAEDIVSSDDLGKVYEKIEQELAND